MAKPRSNRRFWLVTLPTLALSTLIGVKSYQLLQQAKRPIFAFPPMKGLDGQAFTTWRSWTAYPIVINFWATWCPACTYELPMLSKFAKHYSSVKFIGIAIDQIDAVKAFVGKESVFFPTPVVDYSIAKDWLKQFDLDINYLPITIYMNIHREIEFKHIGTIEENMLLPFLTKDHG